MNRNISMFWASKLIKIEAIFATSEGRPLLKIDPSVDERPIVSFCQVISPETQNPFGSLQENLRTNSLDSKISEFVIFIPWSIKKAQLEELNVADKRLGIKIFQYDEGLDPRKLKNQCAQRASGQILFYLEAEDFLPMRAGSYVFNQMMSSPQEIILVLEKPWRNIRRMGILRTSFYELGGFEERLHLDDQCRQLAYRAEKYGIQKLTIPHDNCTRSSTRRSVKLLRPSLKNLKTTMSPFNSEFITMVP